MAFGEHKEKHFFGSLIVCVAALTLAIAFGDISIWLRIAAWLVAVLGFLWCLGPGHAPQMVCSIYVAVADGLREMVRRRH